MSGRAATAAVAVMIGVLFAGSTLLTPLYVIYQQQIGFSRLTLTLIYAVYVVGNLAALFVFGRLSDRIGRRRTALPAIAVTTVSALIFLFADNVVSLYLGRVLTGLGLGIGAGTGTAWLAELIAGDDKARATSIATSANFLGLAIGAAGSGLLAQYAPWPLQLPFILYLVALFGVTALIWRTQETVAASASETADVSLRPHLGVPPAIRAQFVAPAVTGFGAMALAGFYSAIEPTLLIERLHQSNHAVAGALFFELAFIATAIILVTQRLLSRVGMLSALASMIPGVFLLLLAQILGSMPIMIAATAVCGLSVGLGYRGSLQVVNEIAPEDRRAEVVSSYFVCCFCGNALPVIGIGVLSTWANSTIADAAFAGVISIFALAALIFGVKYQANPADREGSPGGANGTV